MGRHIDAFSVLNEVLGDYENVAKGSPEIKNDQIRDRVSRRRSPTACCGLNPGLR